MLLHLTNYYTNIRIPFDKQILFIHLLLLPSNTKQAYIRSDWFTILRNT